MVDVTTVEPLENYHLRLGFSDGTSKVVDVKPYLWGPMFEPLLDTGMFAQVRIEPATGTVSWPNGADLDPLVLHGDFPPAHTIERRSA